MSSVIIRLVAGLVETEAELLVAVISRADQHLVVKIVIVVNPVVDLQRAALAAVTPKGRISVYQNAVVPLIVQLLVQGVSVVILRRGYVGHLIRSKRDTAGRAYGSKCDCF